VADILFFHLSPVIESNVPCVSRYDRRSGLGVVVVGCTASVLRGEMLIYSAFRRRHRRRCSFVSCFQWIVNKQRLLSLQKRDGRLVLVPVSAQYWRYRYQTDTTGIGPIPIPRTGIGLSLLCNHIIPCCWAILLLIISMIFIWRTHQSRYWFFTGTDLKRSDRTRCDEKLGSSLILTKHTTTGTKTVISLCHSY